MGHEIVYCFKCQRRIVGQEFEKGAAYQISHHITCATCAVHLLETLPAKEKEQLLAQMFKATQERQSSSTASRPEIQSASSTRIRAQKDRRKTTGHIPILRLPSGGASPAILAGAIAGIIVLILIVVVVAGGSKPAPPTPPRTAAPAVKPPDGAPRHEAAQAAIQKARQFVKDHPRDFPGQLREWGAAVDAAERTPLFEEARRELGDLTLRRKEAVASELADLDARLRGLVGAEEFKAADLLLEDALKRREGPDWTPAVDAKIRSVRETATKLFATLKAGAVDASSRQALRTRVRKWGLPEFSIDPEPAPPPVEDRPWRSMLAKGLQSLRGQGYGGWRLEEGVLVKTAKDDAAQINEEIEDGEIRFRFECANAYRIRFTLRQGTAEAAFDVYQDLQTAGPGPHEAILVCKGDTVTATFNGRPLAVSAGKARRGLLQFNTAPPTSALRVLAIDFRPLRP